LYGKLTIIYQLKIGRMKQMGKTITFGIQKGGSGKTSTSAITSYLLARAGYKVLAVDMDSQGNMTEMLTLTPSREFRERSIAEALEDEDVTGRIIKFPEMPNLHLVPANDDLAAFPDYALLNFLDLEDGRIQYDEDGQVKVLPDVNLILKRTLAKVKDDYHFIIIDTPPSLSRTTVNALSASDYVVVIFETANFCYSAIDNFMETVQLVQAGVNPNLHIAGILPNLTDSRRFDNKDYVEQAKKDHGELVFNTIIKRRATIGRLPDTGFIDDNKLFGDLNQYTDFIKELLERVSR
jgi:chromosome partitioning protein